MAAQGRPLSPEFKRAIVLVQDYSDRTKGDLREHVEMLSEYLKEEGRAPDFSVRTLGRALDRWGFTFDTGTRSQHLKEKNHVVAARHRYLRKNGRIVRVPMSFILKFIWMNPM